MKRKITLLLLLSLMLSLLLPITAVATQESTVYVRKHVSILYDNSGSMKSPLEGTENLRWCYASYASQMFAGLLNDSDTLDITFMEGDPLHNLDMTKARQGVLNSIFDRTGVATAPTPLSQIQTTLDVLTSDKHNLKPGQGTNPPTEQYWLVLTTDGQFQDDYEQPVSDEDVVTKLTQIMKEYPDLHVVYFGIGAEGYIGEETSGKPDENIAKDFRQGSTNVSPDLVSKLHAHTNFTAVYAENQEQIVSTMRALSNQISGRYTVSNKAEISGNTVKIHLPAEGSPIRNIAIMAQETNARLLSAKAENGTELTISRDGQIRYPHNSNYDTMPEGTLGGYVALITDPAGKKIPNGTVTLTFDQPVSQKDLVLMYEPAIFLKLVVEKKDNSGNWVVISQSDKLLEGDELRVNYAICEDGTGRELDPTELFGETVFQCLLNNEAFSPDETITVSKGDITLEIRASMMDGGYTINVIHKYKVTEPGLEDYTFLCSDPIELYRKEVAENTEKYIEFSADFRGAPATKEMMSKLSVRMEDKDGAPKGKTEQPADHVIRFTPRDDDCLAGEYTLSLYYDKNVVASQIITILPNETTYTAVPGESISILSNHVGDNTDSLSFTVTAHRDQGSGPITAEEAELFTVRAGNGTELKGHTAWTEDGKIHFTMQDASATPGTYPVSLWLDGEKLAETSLTVIHYDATFTVEAIVPNPNRVDRLNLEDNTTAITFLISEDGNPCTAAQMEAMLGREIQIIHDLDSRYAEMEIRIDTYNGKPAIVCKPVYTTGNSIVRYFYKLIISTYLSDFNMSELPVEIKVEMPKGDTGSGILDLYNSNPAPIWIPFLIVLITLTLIFLFFYMNAKSRRLKKGHLWRFVLTPSPNGDGKYTASKDGTSVRIGKGWFFTFFAPIFEKHTMKCNEQTIIFRAEPQKTRKGATIATPSKKSSFFGWNRQNPMVYVNSEYARNYYCCEVAESDTARDILGMIKSQSYYSLEDENGYGLNPQEVLFSYSTPLLRQEAEDGLTFVHQAESYSGHRATGSIPSSKKKKKCLFGSHKKALSQTEDASYASCQIKTELGIVYYEKQGDGNNSNSVYTVIVYDAYRERSKNKKSSVKRPTHKYGSKTKSHKSRIKHP